MRPSGKTNSCRDWSEAGFLQQRRCFAYLNQFGDPGAVCFDLSVKVADALGQSDRFKPVTDTSRGSSRTRHRDTSSIWLPVNGLRASKPKSLIRSSAVNAFTVLVRSVVIE